MGVVDRDAPTVTLAPGGAATVDDDGGGAATATLEVGARVGRYVIQRCIDRGGMGVVYEATDESLGRNVAIKLLRADATRDPSIAARLVREARTAAGLSHPNVVAVYEVGVHGSGPFIAMELVEGATVRQWLADAPRGWRDIVRVFREAGAGIAAAHAAGIVHRDIKPDNILVGNDRVRVADFGIARLALDPAEPNGTVIGTPRYMAPEQRDGREVDARSDQFSFCTSLEEALGDRRDVPAPVRRVIARGLAATPDARYASMDALLRELERHPRSVARYVALGGAAAVCGVATFALMRHGGSPEPCTDSAQQLADTWSETLKRELAGAFAAPGLAYAASSWHHVASRLDRYARDWIGTHRAVCRATHVERTQSPELLDRRMACLDQRKRALATFVAALRAPDAKTIETAASAAESLPRIADCNDLARMTRAAPPTTYAAQAQVEVDLAAARLHQVAARFDEGRRAGQRALDAARAAGDREREAEALYVLGRIELDAGDEAKSFALLQRAQETAAGAGSTPLRILSWTFLGQGYSKVGRFDEAAQLFETALATLTEAPDRLLEGRVLYARGVLRARRGAYEEARVDLERALALELDVLGPDAEPLGRIYNSLAIVARRLGKADEALAFAQRRLELAKQLGADHPQTAMAHNTIGDLLTGRARYDEAQREFERAIEILRAAHGPQSEDLATVHTSLGNMFARRGRWHEATANFRAAIEMKDALGAEIAGTFITRANLGVALVTIGQPAEGEKVLRDVLAARKRVLGEDHRDVVGTYRLIAQALARQGTYDAAAAEFATALAATKKAYGADHTRVAGVLLWMGELERLRKRFSAALRFDEQAHAIYAKGSPAEPEVADVQIALALDHLGLGAPQRARPLGERALAAYEQAQVPEHAAYAKFVVARALWDGNTDRPRAVELARAAREGLAPTGKALEIGEVGAWLALHDAPAP